MPKLPSMIDGFPLEAGDRDCAIQLLINADLENAQALRKAYEESLPKGQGSTAAAVARMLDSKFMESIGEQPDERALYPHLFAARPRRKWLMPALRRFAWNRGQGVSGEPWLGDLAELIGWSLENVKRVSEAEYLALAEQCEALLAQLPLDWRPMLNKYARALEEAGPLSPAVIEAQRKLRRLRVRQPEATVWTRFHADSPFTDNQDCWAARVRRDLGAMEPKLRDTWLRAFDAKPEGGPTQGCLSAVEALGKEQLESGLERWIGMLAGEPGPTLSPDGAAVFQHVIALCGLLGGDPSDRLLYQMACARWSRKEDAGWLATYLEVIGSRPDDRAFACLEALAMNPVTATDRVRREYEALVNVFGARSAPAAKIGIDGFLLDRDPALEAQQTRIDQLLRMGATAAARGPHADDAVRAAVIRAVKALENTPTGLPLRKQLDRMTAPTPWFDGGPLVRAAIQAMENSIVREFSADPASLHQAVAIRTEWIQAHEKEFSEDTLKVWRESIQGLGCGSGLLSRSLEKVVSLSLERLLDAIRANPGRMKVFELSRQYVAEHGWDAELVAALEKWVSTIGTSQTDHEHRAKVNWFLWFEDVAPVQLEACWSHGMKRDLRAMQPEERANWMALLDNHTFIVTDRPPKKWFPPAEAAFKKLGAAAFRKRFVAWFAPFGKPEPLSLTITGRNILRLLMWYALVARDRAVDKALAGFAKARWKTKEIEKRAAQAEMAFSYVLAERAPEVALPILKELVKSGRAFPDSKTHRTYEELRRRMKRR